jgi:signal transduction histidine kinase
MPSRLRQSREASPSAASAHTALYLRGMERLVAAVQELSLARDLGTLMAIVRHAARQLTGADGATFILRDGDRCYYADEDAIAPLWKGRRFPMTACISGWAMLHRQHAVIEDIYADPRIPVEAYRPTFVKSLAMVPIRTLDPIGAIGNYWAAPHRPSAEEVKLLQALADTTAVAMENVQMYGELEQRVRDRTAELEAANRELESFSYAVSHDLRAPVRHVDGFVRALEEDAGAALDATARGHLARIQSATRRMSQLIEDLLALSRTIRQPVNRTSVDLAALARDVATALRGAEPGRAVEFVIPETLPASGDARLLRVALENLLGNAWKFTSRCPHPRIELGAATLPDGQTAYAVRDNGAGFDMAHAGRLFGAFQRLHGEDEFPGTGIGLATVQRIIARHGGRIWAEAAVGQGATFSFTLGRSA